MPLVTGVKGLGLVAAATAALVMLYGVPVEPIWLGASVAFLVIHAAAKMFMQLFSGDMRRYWHGHN